MVSSIGLPVSLLMQRVWTFSKYSDCYDLLMQRVWTFLTILAAMVSYISDCLFLYRCSEFRHFLNVVTAIVS